MSLMLSHRNLRRNKRSVLAILVSICLIAFIFWRILNFQEFVVALFQVSIPLFFASDIPYLIQAGLMGCRLSWAMNKSGVKTCWKESFFIHLFGMFGSDFSAGRVAYLSASLLFKSGLAGSLGTLLTLVIVDGIVKAGLAVASVLYLSGFLGLSVGPALLLFPFSVIAGGGILFSVLINQRFVKLMAKLPFIGKSIVPYYVQFKTALESLKSSLLYLACFTFIGWFLRGCEWYILGQAVGISFSFLTWLMLHPIITFVRMVPVTINGLGIFELTLIGLFPSTSSSKLVAFGILDMINNVFIDIFGLKAVVGKSYRKFRGVLGASSPS